MPAESYVYKKEMHACIISKSMLGLRGLLPRLEGCYMKKILTVVIMLHEKDSYSSDYQCNDCRMQLRSKGRKCR